MAEHKGLDIPLPTSDFDKSIEQFTRITHNTEFILLNKYLTSSHMYQRYIWIAYMAKLIFCSTRRTPNKSRH